MTALRQNPHRDTMSCGELNAKIRCDEDGCGWLETIPRDDIPAWHKKPCPKCGKGQIVNNTDLSLFRIAVAMEKVSNEIDPTGKRKLVHFSTAQFRKETMPTPSHQRLQKQEPFHMICTCLRCGAAVDLRAEPMQSATMAVMEFHRNGSLCGECLRSTPPATVQG